MSLSIVTFANLGKKQNLKTSDILPIIDTFYSKYELNQVICQIHDQFSFKKTVSAFPAFVRYGIGALRRIPLFSLSRQQVERLFDFFAARKLQFADVTFLHGGYFLSATARKARKLGSIPVDIAVSAHLHTNAQLEKEELPAIGFPHYEGLYTRLSRISKSEGKFQYVIAMSEFVKESYAQQGFPIENIFVAAPDIDMQRFLPLPAPENEKKSFSLLYVAHTQPLKGLHYLLDAWKNVAATDAELTIVGGFSDMPESLKNQYMEIIKTDPRIRWIAGTHEPEKYYHDASVLVFPSLTEGFGRVTLEAMACGIPIITTENARGIVEDGKSGFIVPIRSAAAIREKIEFLYHNPHVREQMGREARKAVEQKKPFGEAVYEMYQEILKREGNSGKK